MPNQPLIVVRNITKRFGRKPVLRGVSLAVEQGQVVALLGANGAGKTTLMRVVAGLTRPDGGEVELGGVSFQAAGAELRRYIGLVAHAPFLYDNLDGWENLQFFARMYDLQRPDVRIEALLRTVDLWSRRNDPVRAYSRGMTQRLAIARALLHDPPVLLLDEPDTGLDETSAQMLAHLLSEVGASSRAILFSTHNLERAVAWADSVCILVGGKIVDTMMTSGMDSAQLRDLYTQANQAP